MMLLYKTRDAGANWAAECTATLLQDGYVRGKSNASFFYRPITDTAVMVHGNGCVAVGNKAGLKKIREALGGKYEVKVQTIGG